MTPCGLGMVFGPFFSRGWYLAEEKEACWLLEEGAGENAAGGGWMTDELSSLRLKEVERRTLGWASFKESL